MKSVLTTKSLFLPPRPEPFMLTSPTGWKYYMLPPSPHIIGSIPCPYCKEETEFQANIRIWAPSQLGIKEIITCEACKQLSFVMARLHVWEFRGWMEWAYTQPAYIMCLFARERAEVGKVLEDSLFGLSTEGWKLPVELPQKYHRTERL